MAFGNEAERDEVETAVRRARGAQTAAQIRAHAFDELAANSARLQEDGALELQRLGGAGVLDQRERNVVEALLRDAKADEQTRVLVIEALASGKDVTLGPLLAAAPAATPRVLEALLKARAAVGAPASRSELDLLLASNRVEIRQAALRNLIASGHPQALALLSDACGTDQPREVRLAAIDSLGSSHDDTVFGPLSLAFESDERSIKQASARAILAVGGDRADRALAQLALEGKSRETRTYAAMLLVTRHSRSAPVVQALAAANPPPDVREVLAHGLQDSHGHHH